MTDRTSFENEAVFGIWYKNGSFDFCTKRGLDSGNQVVSSQVFRRLLLLINAFFYYPTNLMARNYRVQGKTLSSLIFLNGGINFVRQLANWVSF